MFSPVRRASLRYPLSYGSCDGRRPGRRLKLELGPYSTFLSRRLVTCSHLIILCFVFFFCFAFLFIDPHTHMISRVNAKLTVIHCHVVFRLKTMA